MKVDLNFALVVADCMEEMKAGRYTKYGNKIFGSSIFISDVRWNIIEALRELDSEHPEEAILEITWKEFEDLENFLLGIACFNVKDRLKLELDEEASLVVYSP